MAMPLATPSSCRSASDTQYLLIVAVLAGAGMGLVQMQIEAVYTRYNCFILMFNYILLFHFFSHYFSANKHLEYIYFV